MIMNDNCLGGARFLLVSNELRLLREKMLLTQEEFAKELGVASSTVNRWEKGKARPNITTMRTIKRICESNNYPYEKIESAWIIH